MKSSIYVLSSTLNFPNGFSASNNKIALMAKGLSQGNYRMIICESLKGTYESYKYDKYDDFDVLTLKKHNLFNFIRNASFLIKRIRMDGEAYLMSSLATYSYLDLIFIFFLRLFCGVKFIYIYHELHESFAKNRLAKIKHHYLDVFACKLASLVLPISHYLNDFARKYNDNTEILPIIYEYKDTNLQHSINPAPIFTYCGTIQYERIINRIIDVFKIVHIEYPKVELNLIISGNRDRVTSFIEHHRKDHYVHFYSGISVEELFRLYNQSYALLIPLDENNIQDQARFSQKIAEYLSTKRPIVTNPVGEIVYYFKDCQNAYIMDSIDVNIFTEKIKEILKTEAMTVSLIGEAGYKTGVEYFDYKKVMNRISETISYIKK